MKISFAILAFLIVLDPAVGKCLGYTCRDGSCTDSIFDRCNGITDCSDRSDEARCQSCQSGFPCDDLECTLLRGDRCDGVIDCHDESDEDSCPTSGGLNIVGLAVGVTLSSVVVLVIGPAAVVVIIVYCVAFAARARADAEGEAGSDSRSTNRRRTLAMSEAAPTSLAEVVGGSAPEESTLQVVPLQKNATPTDEATKGEVVPLPQKDATPTNEATKPEGEAVPLPQKDEATKPDGEAVPLPQKAI